MVPFTLGTVGNTQIGLRLIKPATKSPPKFAFLINRLNPTFKNHVFNGNYSINIFDLLNRFVQGAEMLNMSEAHSWTALTTFLSKLDEKQFRINLRRAFCHGGILCWPEDIQKLFSTHATAYAISNDIEDIVNVEQKAYGKRKILEAL